MIHKKSLTKLSFDGPLISINRSKLLKRNNKKGYNIIKGEKKSY